MSRQVLGAWKQLARRRVAAIVLCGVLGFALPAAFGLRSGLPEPHVHDEFSHLLAADTFAHGRLTNATHRFWRHFESPHILEIPSYMSKYPPAQGAALALGWRLFGHPAFGIWLGAGAAAAATCWMLQAWTRPRWALLGGLLLIISHGIVGSWAQTYWGGMVAAAAGALFLGGFRRTLSRPTAGSSIFMALGLVVLANSRPFEGLMLSLPALALFLSWLFRRGAHCERAAKPRTAFQSSLAGSISVRKKLLIAVLPAAIVLTFGAAGMLRYNTAITGDPWTLPYQGHQRQYYRIGVFVFDRGNPQASQGHARLRRFYDHWKPPLNSRLYFVYKVRDLLELQIHFFFGSVLVVSLLSLPWMLQNRWLAFAAASWLAVIGGLAFATFWDQPHYAAPVMPVALLLCVEGLRRLRTLSSRFPRRDRVKARYLIGLFLAIWIAWNGPVIGRALAKGAQAEKESGAGLTRAQVIRQIESLPGKHLILVRYDGSYTDHDEWVYNAADIDNSRIVWAHDLGAAANAPLLEYFGDREVWLLEIRDQGKSLTRYDGAPSSAT